ncbi:hypothetical protein HYX12_02255 [Candidatus Woesearchaeota archaeon]|nr:hypothetical protein [Candidatus Woesearchaeota archaeon]
MTTPSLEFSLEEIATHIGANAFASITDASTSGLQHLSSILDETPLSIPDISKGITHTDYLAAREQAARATTLAAVTGDARLKEYVEAWVGMQKAYAQKVIAGIKGGVEGLQKQLEKYDEELTKGEQKREALKKLDPKLCGTDAIYLLLKEEVDGLDKVKTEREKTHRALAGSFKVEETLTALINSGIQAIHYRIPSVEEIQELLKDKKYSGPAFEPFTVSTWTSIADLFSRDLELPELAPRARDSVRVRRTGEVSNMNLDDLPIVLSELVRVYQYVLSLAPGTTVVPLGVKEGLSIEIFSTIAISSYFDNNPAVFGVKKMDKGGSKTFIRQESCSAPDKGTFLEAMLHPGVLNHPDLKQVNDFYLQKLLGAMREHQGAYSGFTKTDLQEVARANGFPLSKIYISLGLNEENGIEQISSDDSREEQYKFKDFKVTERQLSYAKDGVAEFGINRFSAQDLASKVTDQRRDMMMSTTVAAGILQQYSKELGLRLVSRDPEMYQRKDRPAAATEPTKAGADKPTGVETLM